MLNNIMRSMPRLHDDQQVDSKYKHVTLGIPMHNNMLHLHIKHKTIIPSTPMC